MPEPSAVRSSVTGAGQSFRRLQGIKPGVMLRLGAEEGAQTSADQEAVMDALGATGGVTVVPELTPEPLRAV